MSFHNNRKSRRINLSQHGILFAEGKMIGTCDVLDVSSGGARLVMNSSIELPSEFILSLARLGRVYRNCQLVWRSEIQAGVRFVRDSA
jgi:hypothetical protein